MTCELHEGVVQHGNVETALFSLIEKDKAVCLIEHGSIVQWCVTEPVRDLKDLLREAAQIDKYLKFTRTGGVVSYGHAIVIKLLSGIDFELLYQSLKGLQISKMTCVMDDFSTCISINDIS